MYEGCQFKGMVMSEVKFKSIKLIDCTFDHVIIEQSFLEDLLLKNCDIKSIQIRGNRKITKSSLFSKKKVGFIKETYISDDCKITELVLCGNLRIDSCRFPSGEKFLHVHNPALIYKESINFIEKNWEEEKRK